MAGSKKKDITGNDLGFGTKPTVNNQRIMNRDGSSNIRRTGLKFFRTTDTYDKLIKLSWTKFGLLILVSYILINMIFASAYLYLGIENIEGAQGKTSTEHFWDAFFFSAQTISTVGYGHLSPKGMPTSLLAAFESMLGLLAFALATGLLYGRFSKPSAKIKFSKSMIMAPYQDGKGLMFRLANYRNNQLIDIEVEVLLSVNALRDGKMARQFYNLELERNNINMLTLSWTVVHPVTEKSPLSGLTPQDLDDGDAEFLILLKAFDDTFSQTVHSRTSYQYEEIVWDVKFKSIIEPDSKGILTLNMAGLSDYEKVETEEILAG